MSELGAGATHTRPTESNIPDVTVVVRPTANPLSLGFLGLFFATSALAAQQLQWVPRAQGHTIAIGILVFTVPAQLIACLFGFANRDLVCATGLAIQSGIWAALAATMLIHRPGSTSSGLALVLFIGAVAMCTPAVGAVSAKVMTGVVLFTTAIRWAITAGYQATASPTWRVAAGAMGLFLACIALYASLAYELEDQHRKTVLPTFRRNSAARAMTGPFIEQVDQIHHEAGVRKHL